MGSPKPTTVIWTRLVSPFLVTESFARQLEDEGLSGWDTYAVEVSGKDGSTIPGYRGFVITGRCGPVDDRRSIQVPKVYPAGTFPVWKGVFFHEESWDGSDFFMPEGSSGWMFAVERVVDAFRRAKIRNVEFTPLAEVERMRL